MASKKPKSKVAKKRASAPKSRASGELNEDELDAVSGGLGYGGKLQLTATTSETIDQTVLNSATIKTALGYGG